jgi:TolB protein
MNNKTTNILQSILKVIKENYVIFSYCNLIVYIVIIMQTSCKKEDITIRTDGAYSLGITGKGSFQNPAWSPDNYSVVLTNFLNGYNTDPADVLLFEISNGSVRKLVSDGSANINLPGSCWNAAMHTIVFSSSREPHDEIYLIPENGPIGSEIKITSRTDIVAYEPSISPDGQWIVFESHKLDVDDNGIITKFNIDGTSSYIQLSDANDDCRQPNWSPAGNLILYQKLTNQQWDIWVMDTQGNNKTKVTSGGGDKTDASFSPDGQHIVYSSNEGGEKYANLYIIPSSGGTSKKITNYDSYDGAPSWSSDGKKILFESSFTDPETPTLWTPADPEGTRIWIIDL